MHKRYVCPIFSQLEDINKDKKVEKMSLADLKAECRRLSLPVSGSKPDLLNRVLEHREVVLGSVKILLCTFFGCVSNIC